MANEDMVNQTGHPVIVVAQAEDAEGPVVVVENGEPVHSELEELQLSEEVHTQDGHGVFPPFDPSTFGPQLLWLAITFGLLYVIMSRVALPRIGAILEDRRARVEGDLAEADRLRQETDKAIEAYETALAEARARAHGIAEETRVSLKADLDGRRAGVEADLAEKVAAAEARIAETKTAALQNVDAVAAETAAAVVAQLVGAVSDKAARDAVASVVKG